MEVEGRNKQQVAAGVQIFEDALHPPVGRLLQEAVHQLLGLLRLGEVHAADERCVGEVLRASNEVLGELCVLASEDPHLGGPQEESDEGSVGVDRGQQGVGALLLAADRLVHPQTQRVQQRCQDRRPLCDVLPLWFQFRRIPAVWCEDLDIEGGHRKRLQRLGGLGLQGLAADILRGEEVEGVDVDADFILNIKLWRAACDATEQGCAENDT
ncbi:hypothetical protein EYF80_026461 [Liparis tanakae]|uniref:Uncharacterized protein n=1 Tax=Liparis tanakae TaxID=230148 RepID=A0A4Z2HC09_9TELE|nr:hypothetical protein EYF80_026461 [Liparis tanakae]